MKKSGIINADISRVLSYMGHTDWIAIGDCGLPIPDEVERIDLSVCLGTPSFMKVLREVTDDMKVEKLILAEEIKESNNEALIEINKLQKECNNNAMTEFVSHEELKQMLKKCKAVIRTGESTPYANIILQAACLF